MFGKNIEELYEKHLGSHELMKSGDANLSKYPVYIKKPSKRIYINDSDFTYHTSSID